MLYPNFLLENKVLFGFYSLNFMNNAHLVIISHLERNIPSKYVAISPLCTNLYKII